MNLITPDADLNSDYVLYWIVGLITVVLAGVWFIISIQRRKRRNAGR